ncbi:ArsR/SmtB family transcription factor [Streptomyces sp. H39-S7]|uniref:ArsR/SmtB family transcription factor n=1 Tax=Streptomyces sp. H39-S7 TaxID=3004357 RepID=UPI0022AF13AD|nr:helix-turn-helix domain-containing protein [Streptomyces sp. H39-S7]MCZ4121702.1 helix-turn-helix domain-containing protein [Streptomyces sp. H39-S7]
MTGPRTPATLAALAALAALLADETRASVCLALLDRRAWTSGELARHCGVAPSTISEHLTRLVDGGLLVQERQGRHRYVRLADPDTARMIEDLAAHVAPRKPAGGGLRAHSAGQALARGRTCYDHLAGRLGVAITDAMTARGLLSQDAGFALTGPGLAWLTGLGADLSAYDLSAAAGPAASSRRPLARSCLDWTERRPHLAGTAGAELCRLVLDRGWATRIGTRRAVRVTPLGLDELHRTLGIEPDRLEVA